nr:polysaccharide export protein EpsE [Variovorax boronicumulans]
MQSTTFLSMSYWRLMALCCLLWAGSAVHAQVAQPTQVVAEDYRLGAGDTVRVLVFQSPDLTVEARVSENGAISVPLVGNITIGGLSIADAERKIAEALKSGGYLQRPQVNIVLLQVRGNQVSVLGQVQRPGRFPLELANTRVSDVLAMAGGINSNGDDTVILSGVREGQPFRRLIDIPALFLNEDTGGNLFVAAGDTLYVHRAPVFYIYGEVNRAGPYRIERGMTVMQGLAMGGGPTNRGSETRLRLHRRDASGAVQQTTPTLTDALQANDVIYVRESLF